MVRYGLLLTFLAVVGVLAISAQGTPDAGGGFLSDFAQTVRRLLLFSAVVFATLGHWGGVGLYAFLHAAERPFYENAGLTTLSRALWAWPLSFVVAGLLLVAGLGVGG